MALNMGLRGVISFLVMGLLCLATPVLAFQSDAKFAYLYDMSTDTTLYEKNGYTQMGPSSMTKLMTAYILFDELKKGNVTLDTTFPVSEKAWRKGGSKMFVRVGDRVRVEDLLRGIIVVSGNDACIVVAEALAGSEEAFAVLMNDYAKRLDLKDSHFKNATGWPDEEHLMSSHDLALLASHIITDFPEYYPYYSEKEFTHNGVTQPNRNRLLWREASGVDGLKTGHTEENGYGITVSGKMGERRLVAVVNGLSSEAARIQAAAELMGYGFRAFEKVRFYQPGEEVVQADVWMGSEATVPLGLENAFEISLPKTGRERYSLEVNYQAPWPAPIQKGQHIANLVLKDGEKTLREVKLVALQDVEELSLIPRLLFNLKHRFGFN